MPDAALGPGAVRGGQHWRASPPQSPPRSPLVGLTRPVRPRSPRSAGRRSSLSCYLACVTSSRRRAVLVDQATETVETYDLVVAASRASRRQAQVPAVPGTCVRALKRPIFVQTRPTKAATAAATTHLRANSFPKRRIGTAHREMLHHLLILGDRTGGTSRPLGGVLHERRYAWPGPHGANRTDATGVTAHLGLPLAARPVIGGTGDRGISRVPGSRAWRFRACPGSSTARGPPTARA